ncbi:Signal transduction histidine kinase [Promicromonospora umidemergens]|uniref:histidine kinase n=1 Tax=Promicromonospora umidemergens TaxID=629679 RepID=A0ABP8Y272_9MICO|nr:histidine kinase [Promicromonospora umidemergens]MCP2284482.1 Signal transduction histidine kinase [Promicromonospora umidemergens]
MVHAPPRSETRPPDGDRPAVAGPDVLRPAGRLAGLLDWFGVDADWERVPAGPDAYRKDLLLGAGFAVLAAISVELGRSMGIFEGAREPLWLIILLAVVSTAPLAWRRRYPLVSLALVYGLWLGLGLTISAITVLMPMQVMYFVALFTAVAWARDRRAMLVVVSVCVLMMFTWLIWMFAVQQGMEMLLEEFPTRADWPGLIEPYLANAVYQLITNIAFFGGAVVAGQMQWNAARRRRQLSDQADTIERQAAALTDQAIVAERVRIARELHDVVAHHVSVIGIQAAAARRVLDRDPARTAEALVTIERESREGVAQMRNLVGTLRSVPDGGARDDPPGPDGGGSRAPEPGLADLPALTAADHDGLDTTFRQVEEPPGTAADVTDPMGLSLYRTAQEAMANVRKHSTARSATVTLRVVRAPEAIAGQQFEHGFAEVEVLDDGRPRRGTSGSGLGLLGIRERAATHQGVVEIGTRATGGFRVRVRLPLPAPDSEGRSAPGPAAHTATTASGSDA